MRKLLAEIIAPGAIEAALQIGERWWGLFVLIPVNTAVTRDWGALASLLGVASTVVASPYFVPPHREYGVRPLVLNVGVILASLLPLIVPRLDIPADWLAALTRIAYLVFHAAVGVLLGGAWSGGSRRRAKGRHHRPSPRAAPARAGEGARARGNRQTGSPGERWPKPLSGSLAPHPRRRSSSG